MGFLRRFLTLLFSVLLLIGVVGFSFVEGALRLNVYNLEKDIQKLERLAHTKRTSGECADEVFDEGGKVRAYTLRFVDETHYVTELECDIKSESVRLSSGSLGMGVKKIRGSGIRWALDDESVNSIFILENSFRSRAVGVKDNAVFSSEVESIGIDGPTGDEAVTSCQGWGGVCCTDSYLMGAGEEYSKVNDCSGSCYSSCLSRPLASVFTGDPGFDMQKRVLHTTSGQQTTFAFRVEDFDGEVKRVWLDFGDGETAQGLNAVDSVTHAYACSEESCVYTARLLAEDDDSLVLSPTRLNSMQVLVR